MGYRFIGSKIRVVDGIIDYLESSIKRGGRFIDAFSGTGIVASTAANLGWSIHINDLMKCAVVLSETRLLSKQDALFMNFGGYNSVLKKLNEAEAISGFFYKEYSPASVNTCGIERKYFTESNAGRIDAILLMIKEWADSGVISSQERSLLLASLMCAMNNVANIAGTYGCFLSKWTSQAQQTLTLHPLPLRDKPVDYTVSNTDVFDVHSNEEDVIYLDPPYTKRQYASYYHILETVAIGDEPCVQGVAGLRPWKEKASVFCYKRKALDALSLLILKQEARCVLLSYSDEGHIGIDDLLSVLSKNGEVRVVELSSIGRYRPNKVASANRSEVKEYLIDFRHR